MTLLQNSLTILKYNKSLFGIMTIIIIGIVQAITYMTMGSSQTIPLIYLSAGAMGISAFIITSFLDKIIEFIVSNINNTVKQFMMIMVATITAKIIISDILMNPSVQLFIKDNFTIGIIIYGILSSSYSYMLYKFYDKM